MSNDMDTVMELSREMVVIALEKRLDNLREMMEAMLGMKLSGPEEGLAMLTQSWIPAAERMPEMGQRIVVWDTTWRDPFITRMKGKEMWHTSRYTHWMPVPDAPA